MGSKKALWGVPLAVMIAVVAFVAVWLQREARHPGEVEGRMPDGNGVGQRVDVTSRLTPAEVEPTQKEAEERVEADAVEEPPNAGWIHGRVLVPRGNSPEGLRLWARPAGPRTRNLWRSLPASVTLGADGAFELGPLVVGEVTVHVGLPAGSRPGRAARRGSSAGSVELGTVEVLAGVVTERDFTLLDVPGTIRATVTSFGFPVSGATVHFESHHGGRESAPVGADGTTEPKPLFPGPWSVYVFDRARGWSYRHPHFAYVVAGRALEVDVALQLVEGTVTIIDEESLERLAEEKLSIRMVREAAHGGPGVSSVPCQTDAAGRLTLELIPGDYVLEKEERSAVLTWTVAGPAAAEIDL